MSAEQRVTDEELDLALGILQSRENAEFADGGLAAALDLRDSRAAHRATEAKLRAALAEGERLKADAPKVSDADWNDASDEQKRQYLNLTMRTCNAHFEQAMSNGASANKQRARAEAAESDLAATKAKLEVLEAVACIAWRLCIHVDLVPYTNSMGVTLSSSVGVYEELKERLAALTTKEATDAK